MHRGVKDVQELLQGGLIHHINHAHLNHQEIQDATPSGDRSELLTGFVDLDLRLTGHQQFFTDLLGRFFGGLQHSHQRLVFY